MDIGSASSVADLLLLLAAATLVLVAVLVLHRAGRRALPFLALLALDLGVTLLALSRHDEGTLFYSALGLFGILVLIPQLLGGLARGALRAGNLARARAVVAFRRALQPGAGHEGDLAVLDALIGGRSDAPPPTADRYRAFLSTRHDPALRLVLIERLLVCLLAEGRAQEALDLFEAEGGVALASASPGIAQHAAAVCAAAHRPEEAAHYAAFAAQGLAARRGRWTGYYRMAPASTALLGILALVHLVTMAVGSADEGWLLCRFGANMRSVTLHGEPWRLVTSMFLHAGLLHLVVNLYALYVMGRLVEQLVGSLNVWVVYMVSGIMGSAASASLGAPYRLSVGASGAIFGLLGAAVIMLLRLRGAVPESWRKNVTYNLLLVILLNLYIGYAIKFVDNAAHLGGLAGGALAGVLLVRRPGGVGSMAARRLGQAAAGLFVAVVLGAAVMAAVTPFSRTLGRMPWQDVSRAGVVARVPAHWVVRDGAKLVVQDPLVQVLWVEFEVDHMRSRETLEEYARQRVELLWQQLRQDPDVRDVRPLGGPSRSVDAPAIHVAESRLTVFQKPYRQIVFFRREQGVAFMVEAVLPEARMPDYASVLLRVAESIRYRSVSGPGT